MKRFISMVLALSLIMTIFVACDDQTDNNASANGASNVSSVEELTSDEQDAWGNASLEVGTEASETTSADASSDKDQGFLGWVTLG